jgi:hypothetical protein
MNKSGFQIRNNYFRAALYIELIVNNMKYRGIQCDFGRLTNVFFVTPDSLLIAVQRETDFFQYTYYGRVFNPAQKGVLNKAGFALHKSSSRNPRLTDAVGQAATSSDRVVRAGSIPVRQGHPGGQHPASPSDRVIRAGSIHKRNFNSF